MSDPYLPPEEPFAPLAQPEAPGTALRISWSGITGIALLSFVLVLMFFVVGQFVQLLNLPFGLVITSLLIFGAAGLFFPATFNLKPAAFTGLSRNPHGYVVLAFVIGVANLPLANFLMGAMRELLPTSWSKGADETTELLLNASHAARIVLVIAAGVAAPIGEELFFRGWMQGLLSQRLRSIFSVIIVAAVFSFVHLDRVGFVARVELGILFGLARAWSGSLWPAIAMHSAHNLFSTAALYFQPDAEADIDAPFEWASAGALAAGSLIVTFTLLWWFHRLTRGERKELREIPETERVPVRLTPARGAMIFGPASLLLVVSVVLLVIFRDRLPGTELTSGLLPQLPTELGGKGPSLFAPKAPDPEDGGTHLK